MHYGFPPWNSELPLHKGYTNSAGDKSHVSCVKADPGWCSGWAEEWAQKNNSAYIRGGRQIKELWKPRWGWMLTRHWYPEHKNEKQRAVPWWVTWVRETKLAAVFQLNWISEGSWQVPAATRGPHKHFTACLFRHGWEMQQRTSANNRVPLQCSSLPSPKELLDFFFFSLFVPF